MIPKTIWKQKSGYSTNAHNIFEKYLRDSDDPKCMKNICEARQSAKIIQSWDADSIMGSFIVKQNSCKWTERQWLIWLRFFRNVSL